MTVSIEKRTVQITIGVAIAVIIAIATFAFNLGMKLNQIQEEIETLQVADRHIIDEFQKVDAEQMQKCAETRGRIDALEAQNTDLKVKLAKIETQLTGIETILIEIKGDVKQHQADLATGVVRG